MQPRVDPRPLLRLEVGRLRHRETRRVFDRSVHVGELAGERDSFVVRAQDLPVMDRGLCVDVMLALLAERDAVPAATWLVRPGVPEPEDADFEWLAAASYAFSAYGAQLSGFYVVTRSGWLDLQSGDSQVWKRLRL